VKKLVVTLLVALLGVPAYAEEKKADEKAKVELKEKKKDEGKIGFTPAISVWNAWGYQRENPFLGQSVYFMPSFKRGDHSLSAFVGLSAEFTQPDDGRRMYWSNTFLTYSWKFWAPKVGKHKFAFSTGGQVILPTDEAARVKGTMRLAFGPLVRAAWTYGMLTLSYRVSFLKYWNGSTTEQITVDENPNALGLEVQPPVNATTGRANPNYQVLHVPGISLAFTKKLSFDAQVWIFNQTGYDLGAAAPELSSPNAVPGGGSRDSYWAFGEIAYQFYDWFSLGLGFSLSANQLSPSSRLIYLPINNYNNNFVTYISTTFSPKL
jgi:hypothetical protein